MQPIDEEEENLNYDPADKYKHLAVVDCSKAFSNQEVSYFLNVDLIYDIFSVFLFLTRLKP
jgi:hypothetical protein